MTGVPLKRTPGPGPGQFKFLLPEDLRRGMTEHPEVRWAEVCRRAIRKALADLAAQPRRRRTA